MPASKYTTISHLRNRISDRNMSNLMVDRSTANFDDVDVVKAVEDLIIAASDDFDGYVRGHIDVPIQPSVSSLTGTFTFTEGSTDVSITGGAALTELSVGDEIRPDIASDYRGIVEFVTDDDNVVLVDIYYGLTLADEAASKYVHNVPSEIELLVRGHACYLMWARRKEDLNNPKRDKEQLFMRRVDEIQRGSYKIKLVDDEVVSDKHELTDKTVKSSFTDDSMGGFFP